MQGKARSKKEKLEIFRSLEPLFQLGYTLNRACKITGIPTSTAHDIIQNDETLRMKMQAARSYVSTAARQNVVNKITKEKDVATSRWWLERQEPEDFKAQQKIEADVPFLNLAELRREKEKRLASKEN